MPGHSLALIQSDEKGGTIFALSHPYQSGSTVSGVRKLAQNFVAELLTRRGSVRFDPLYGSRFPGELRGYNVLSVNELHGILARGIDDVKTNLRNRERMSDTPDEWLASADIVEIEQHLDSVVIHIRLMTVAGRTTLVQIPMNLYEYA